MAAGYRPDSSKLDSLLMSSITEGVTVFLPLRFPEPFGLSTGHPLTHPYPTPLPDIRAAVPSPGDEQSGR